MRAGFFYSAAVLYFCDDDMRVLKCCSPPTPLSFGEEDVHATEQRRADQERSAERDI